MLYKSLQSIVQQACHRAVPVSTSWAGATLSGMENLARNGYLRETKGTPSGSDQSQLLTTGATHRGWISAARYTRKGFIWLFAFT